MIIIINPCRPLLDMGLSVALPFCCSTCLKGVIQMTTVQEILFGRALAEESYQFVSATDVFLKDCKLNFCGTPKYLYSS